MSKLLVLTGSPRINGNSYILADDFIRGAEEAGHEVRRMDTAKLKLGACQACDHCFSGGKPCIYQNGDDNEVLEAVLAADAVVFVTPVYWYTFPTQLKAVIDKFYAFMVGNPAEAFHKKTALIAVCGDETDQTFEGMRFAYEKTAELMQWEIVKELTYSNYNDAGAIQGTEAEEEVYRLGREMM